jgi:hypothetical protein
MKVISIQINKPVFNPDYDFKRTYIISGYLLNQDMKRSNLPSWIALN